MEPMTAKDWERFFDYLDRIVNADLPTVDDKIQMVKEQAEEHHNGQENLEEFTSWIFED